MRQRTGNGDKRDDIRTQRKERRLDVTLPQVAGSALAAIAAAVLASQLGVYGTVIGAGVVSVIATCGGSFFQHLFRRTGERMRTVAGQARPKARQVPAHGAEGGAAASAAGVPPAGGEFGTATMYGTRLRGWKRPVGMAVVAFLAAMICITGYELAAGRDLSGGRGTTIGSVVGGSGGSGGGHSAPGGTTPSPGSPSTTPHAPAGGGGPSSPGTTHTSGTPGTGTGGPGTGTSPGTGSSGSPQPPAGRTPSAPGGPTPSAPPPTPTGGTGAPDGGGAGLRSGAVGSDR